MARSLRPEPQSKRFEYLSDNMQRHDSMGESAGSVDADLATYLD